MRRLIAAVITLLVTLTLAVFVTSTAAQAATPYALWYVNYGNYYGTAQPTIYSNRVPSWRVGNSTSWLIDQSDCNLVEYHAGQGAKFASNTAGQAAPCQTRWQLDGNVVKKNHGGSVIWATNTNGYSGQTRRMIMTLWSNDCVTVHDGSSGTSWVEKWKSQNISACNISIVTTGAERGGAADVPAMIQ